MAAASSDVIPEEHACPGGCRYEPKFDGFRCIGRVDDDGGVQLWSRRQRHLNAAFPEIVLAVYDALPPGTVVDGEIVRYGRDGRLDFSALQRRHVAGRRRASLALSEPCHYVIWDVLETAGVDFRPAPLAERREVLEHLLAGLPGASRIVLCPQLRDAGQARLLVEILLVQGIEGLVIKAAAGRYREGKRDWWKVKHRTTTEMIIGGVTGAVETPRTLILGRYGHGRRRLRVVARSTPLTSQARRELGGLLEPAGQEHPWPEPLPAGWAGGLPGAAEPISYTRVLPEIVVEVSVDAAAEHGRWRHAVRYLRVRGDLQPHEVPEGLDIE